MCDKSRSLPNGVLMVSQTACEAMTTVAHVSHYTKRTVCGFCSSGLEAVAVWEVMKDLGVSLLLPEQTPSKTFFFVTFKRCHASAFCQQDANFIRLHWVILLYFPHSQSDKQQQWMRSKPETTLLHPIHNNHPDPDYWFLGEKSINTIEVEELKKSL